MVSRARHSRTEKLPALPGLPQPALCWCYRFSSRCLSLKTKVPSLSSLRAICIPLRESRREKETPGRRQAVSLAELYGEKQGCRWEVRTDAKS